MSFGPDVECGTACVAGVVMEFSGAKTVDAPAAEYLCVTETVGVPATFCEVETAGVSSSWSDMILVAKNNVHPNGLDQCFSKRTFNHRKGFQF